MGNHQNPSGKIWLGWSQWQDSRMLQQSQVWDPAHRQLQQWCRKMVWLMRGGEEGAGGDFWEMMEERWQWWLWGDRKLRTRRRQHIGKKAKVEQTVRGGIGVDNPECSWKKGCWLSDQIKEWVLNQFLKERKIFCCCEWADRIKSLQKENTHQRPCTEYRSKSALPEQFIPPLACTQGKFL